MGLGRGGAGWGRRLTAKANVITSERVEGWSLRVGLAAWRDRRDCYWMEESAMQGSGVKKGGSGEFCGQGPRGFLQELFLG